MHITKIGEKKIRSKKQLWDHEKGIRVVLEIHIHNMYLHIHMYVCTYVYAFQLNHSPFSSYLRSFYENLINCLCTKISG